MFYNGGLLFWDMMGISVARATFWLLIIGGITLSLFILFQAVVNYLTEDLEKKKKE